MGWCVSPRTPYTQPAVTPALSGCQPRPTQRLVSHAPRVLPLVGVAVARRSLLARVSIARASFSGGGWPAPPPPRSLQSAVLAHWPSVVPWVGWAGQAHYCFTCRPAGRVRGFSCVGRSGRRCVHARHPLGRSPRAAVAPPQPPSPWGELARFRGRASRKRRILRRYSAYIHSRWVYYRFSYAKRSRAMLRRLRRPFGRPAPRIFRSEFFAPILCNNHRLLQVLTISLT